MKFIMQIIRKIAYSIKYTYDGLYVLWGKEQSFRLEVYVSLIAVPLAFYLPFSPVYKLILLLLLILLVTTEIINSAIEVVVDRISIDIHPQSKFAKDLGCASVAMIVLMNVLAWGFAFASIT